jgi:hypothetical protein
MIVIGVDAHKRSQTLVAVEAGTGPYWRPFSLAEVSAR